MDGKILSATLDNPVQVMARDCADVASCGNSVRYQTDGMSKSRWNIDRRSAGVA
jgi:hypothetical protein